MKRIGIIGCGNLGTSILQGVIGDDENVSVIASRRSIEAIQYLQQDRVEVTSDNEYLIANSDMLIVTLKPYTILPFIKEHAHLLEERHVLVSAATGITINELNSAGPNAGSVFRVMPNTAAAVDESITAICGEGDKDAVESVESVFKGIGQVVHLKEQLMEAATILGACGVAYVLRFMRAMIQGGIEVGFDAKTATQIVAQTMKGASELVIKNGTHPEEEIDKVTTPKGCTIVGLNEMEHAGFSSSLIKGIVSSYKKIES
jgi:pyrroline-5-carboxylate reductase